MAPRKKATPKDPQTIQTLLMDFIEQQAFISHKINDIATATLKNKAIYEAEILDLLARMTELEKLTAAALKEVTRNGNSQQ